jgi:protein involved in polysaccharide export with SLBB domain
MYKNQKCHFIFITVFLIIFLFINNLIAQESAPFSTELDKNGSIQGMADIKEEIKTDLEEETGTDLDPGSVTPGDISAIKEQSNIEAMYNTRTDSPLTQFGYNFFKGTVVKGLLPVGDEYPVGPGDSIAIYFWGDPVDILGLTGFYTITIDREGKIFVPNLGVFYVWGLTVSQTEDIIFRAMAKKFKQFEIEVSLGKLREFPVYVSGYVKNPGVVLATGVYNVLDVLTATGGIEKNGSLRDIVLKRFEKNKINEIKIDLYDLLIYGKPINIRVKEGDSIIVNPINKTAGISGVIKRPAVYEFTSYSNINDLINISGGVLPSAYSVGVKLVRYEKDTLQIYEGDLKDFVFLTKGLNDGDLVLIEPLYNLIANEINIKGHIAYPGKYPYEKGMKLGELLNKIGILPDTNLDLAEISRGKNNEIINFNPFKVLSGKSDVLLYNRDTITFYPDMVQDPVRISGEVENPILIPYYSGITLLDVLNSVDFKGDVKDLKAEIFSEDEEKYSAVYLYDLMISAIKTENLLLRPGDNILIKYLEPKEKSAKVTVLGEVKNPGVYAYKTDMKLYDLLLQSGGYTEDAYPYGLIYIKESAKRLQTEQIEFVFTTLEEYLLKTEENASYSSEISQSEKEIFQITLLRHKQLLENLEKRSRFNLGRIALDTPDTLEDLKNSKDNIIIDQGDYIYVPRKPSHVLVIGDVFNQISMPYKEDYTVKQYIEDVGGLTKNSDKKEIYVIRANGKVIAKRQYSYAKFYNMKMKRGDTIVIPSKIKVPVVWRYVLRDTTQILFQALSTVALVMSF